MLMFRSQTTDLVLYLMVFHVDGYIQHDGMRQTHQCHPIPSFRLLQMMACSCSDGFYVSLTAAASPNWGPSWTCQIIHCNCHRISPNKLETMFRNPKKDQITTPYFSNKQFQFVPEKKVEPCSSFVICLPQRPCRAGGSLSQCRSGQSHECRADSLLSGSFFFFFVCCYICFVVVVVFIFGIFPFHKFSFGLLFVSLTHPFVSVCFWDLFFLFFLWHICFNIHKPTMRWQLVRTNDLKLDEWLASLGILNPVHDHLMVANSKNFRIWMIWK